MRTSKSYSVTTHIRSWGRFRCSYKGNRARHYAAKATDRAKSGPNSITARYATKTAGPPASNCFRLQSRYLLTHTTISVQIKFNFIFTFQYMKTFDGLLFAVHICTRWFVYARFTIVANIGDGRSDGSVGHKFRGVQIKLGNTQAWRAGTSGRAAAADMEWVCPMSQATKQPLQFLPSFCCQT